MAAKVPKQMKYYARVGDNRLMAGLMHVIVRNDMESEDDCVEEYFNNWGSPEGSGGPDNNAQDSHPFTNTIIDNDPNRTGLNHAIGDYDVFLYFVTIGAKLSAAATPGTALTGLHNGGTTTTMAQDDFEFETSGLVGQMLKNTTAGTSSTIYQNTASLIDCNPVLSWESGNAYAIANNPEGNTWYTASPTHAPCRSFVRYQLISRHNNAYGHAANNEFTNYGVPVYEYGNSTAGQASQNILVDQALVSGATRLIVNNSTCSSENFGNLGNDVANNTYFPPVSNIEIYGEHGLSIDEEEDTFISGVDHFAIQRHDTTFYNLIVDIDLFAYNNDDTSTVTTFFRNKVNIFYQPFGESTEVQFSTSEFTS